MGPFRCTTCGAPSDQAASCSSCGGRTFVLRREALMAPARTVVAQPRGQLVSIADAPSLRLGRRRLGPRA
jgi:DNA-directed RNA polymerase subunit RPC12/RpoP